MQKYRGFPSSALPWDSRRAGSVGTMEGLGRQGPTPQWEALRTEPPEGLGALGDKASPKSKMYYGPTHKARRTPSKTVFDVQDTTILENNL